MSGLTQLDGARALIRQAAEGWEQAGLAGRSFAAARAKVAATNAALLATSRVLQVIGGRAATKSMPLERAYRDIRTVTLMPPSLDAALRMVGKGALDVDG